MLDPLFNIRISQHLVHLHVRSVHERHKEKCSQIGKSLVNFIAVPNFFRYNGWWICRFDHAKWDLTDNFDRIHVHFFCFVLNNSGNAKFCPMKIVTILAGSFFTVFNNIDFFKSSGTDMLLVNRFSINHNLIRIRIPIDISTIKIDNKNDECKNVIIIFYVYIKNYIHMRMAIAKNLPVVCLARWTTLEQCLNIYLNIILLFKITINFILILHYIKQ